MEATIQMFAYPIKVFWHCLFLLNKSCAMAEVMLMPTDAFHYTSYIYKREQPPDNIYLSLLYILESH